MRLFIDCEFDGQTLLSMALVANDGQEWYEVRKAPVFDPWVAEHVVPMLGKPGEPDDVIKEGLVAFLGQWDTVTIASDHPADIMHFCRFITGERGAVLQMPRLWFTVMPGVPDMDEISEVPHNALSDARAVKAFFEASSA